MHRIDLHIHTRRFSACAELLDPELLQGQLRKRGLQGAVIAEHDALWPKHEIAELNARSPDIRLYRGAEISSAAGHFVAIGLEDLENVPVGVALEVLIAKVRENQAALILVHPHLKYTNIRQPIKAEEMPEGIHAIEVASSLTHGDHCRDACRLAGLKKWVPVAGSDAHALENVGQSFTAFAELPADEKALALAIRSGLGIPFPIL